MTVNLNTVLIAVTIASTLWSGIFRVNTLLTKQEATAAAVADLRKQQQDDRAAQSAVASDLRREQKEAAEKLERAQELWRYDLGEIKVALAQNGLYRTVPPIEHERK